MHVSKTFKFEASHQIDGHFGKCARLHGHSWHLSVFCEGPIVPETGVVIDYYDIKQVIDPIIEELDHHHLGYGYSEQFRMSQPLISDVSWIPYGFKPTSENLLVLIAYEITKRSHNFGPNFQLPWVCLIINETCTSSAALYRSEYIKMKGGIPYDKERHSEEGSEEGKEVPEERQESREDVNLRALVRPGSDPTITDDDIPF